jgi:hypothetical protein
MLFSAMIPNFFFKASKNPEQFSEISLSNKKSSNTLEIKSFDNKFLLDSNILLLALYLQRASSLLTTLNHANSTKTIYYKNFLLSLDLIPKYQNNLVSAIFLSTKSDYNNYYNYNFDLSDINKGYYISGKELNYLSTYTSTLDLLTVFKSNFKLQKFISNNVTKNLNLAKQNRWGWKSSIFDDKSFTNLATITHLKKTLFNSELSTSASNKNI